MRILICFMILCFGASSAIAMQGFEPEKNLEGVWDLDYTKTAELWDTPELKELGADISLVPIASPTLVFSQAELSYQFIGSKSRYEVESFDDDARLLTIVADNSDRKSTIQFLVPDDDTLILDLPVSVLGPVQVAYTRKAPRNETNENSLLTEIAGDWFVDDEATRKLWEQIAQPDCLANYAPFGERAIQGARQIKISDAEIEYSDQTFEPWQLYKAEDGVFQLGDFSGSAFEVQVVSENVLQLIDKERRLLAIYKREQDHVVDLENLPNGQTAESFFRNFRPIEPKNNAPGIRGVIARSGSVELDEIFIERRRASYSAAKADLVNMELTLFVGLPEKHYGYPAQRLVKLVRLDDVYDERGGLLLTEKRREGIRYLKHPVMSSLTMHRRHGVRGPGFSFILDAPSIGATRLRKISGEIELTRVSEKLIRFSQVDGNQDEDLTHAMLDGKSFRVQVRPGEFPEFALQCSSETMELIKDWYLVDASGQKLKWTSMGKGKNEETRGFDDPIPKDIDLVLHIYDRETPEKYPFSFENISIQW